AALVGVAEAELPDVIVSPALHGAVVEQRAGVEAAGRHRGGGATGADVDSGQGVAHLAVLAPPRPGVAQPERARVVAPPPPEGAGVEHGAGVAVARVDLDGGPARTERDVGQGVAHLARPVAAVDDVAQAELAAGTP